MDDEEEIRLYTDLAGDGVSVSYNIEGNPFVAPTTEELFSSRLETNRRVREEVASAKKLTLIQRTEMERPNIPPCQTRATRMTRTATMTTGDWQAPSFSRTGAQTATSPRRVRRRKLNMRELCDEKRDIYRLQMLIDRKTRQMQKLRNQRTKEETNYKTETQRITELSDEYKKALIQMEVAVAREKRLADRASHEKTKKSKELERHMHEVRSICYEITKNEATKNDLTQYADFLQQFCPPGKELMEFYSKPEVLIEELHRIERENLYIIQHCQHIEEIAAIRAKPGTKECDNVKDMQEEAQALLTELKEVGEFVGNLSLNEQNRIKSEYTELTQLIKTTYHNCFRIHANLEPLFMLEKLELELERMYKLEDSVEPAFLEMKRAAQHKARREEQRKKVLEQKAAEQNRKIQQTLERATKPIFYRWRRPIVERMVPFKEIRREDEMELQRRREEEKERQLLFGELE